MPKFSKGDHVEAISDFYKKVGIKLGQRGRVVAHCDGLYDVEAEVINDVSESVTIWPFYEDEIKLVNDKN